MGFCVPAQAFVVVGALLPFSAHGQYYEEPSPTGKPCGDEENVMTFPDSGAICAPVCTAGGGPCPAGPSGAKARPQCWNNFCVLACFSTKDCVDPMVCGYPPKANGTVGGCVYPFSAGTEHLSTIAV